MEIKISVENRIPKLDDTGFIIQDNTDIKCKVTFDSEWTSGIIQAYCVLDNGNVYDPIIISNGEFTVPAVVNSHTRSLYIGFANGNVKTTKPCQIGVAKSIKTLARNGVQPPSQSVYQQIISMLQDLQSNKVDKITGKGLSTNDYTDTDKGKVEAIPEDPKYTDTVYDDTSINNQIAALQDLQSNKVDKITGKGLSTNDYTDTDKGKVEAIPEDPKYTDTVYDDTSINNQIAALSGNAIELSKVGAVLSATGAFTTSANYKRSDYIPVYKGQSILINDGAAGSNVAVVAIFDNNKSYIASESIAGKGTGIATWIDGEYYIKNDGYVIISDNVSVGKTLARAYITPNVTTASLAKSTQYGNSITVKKTTLPDGQSIVAEKNSIRKNYTIKLYTKLPGGTLPDDAFISLGHGQDGITHGQYIKISNSDVTIHTTNTNEGADSTTRQHGLQLKTYVDATLTVYPDCTFNIEIATLDGRYTYYYSSTWSGDRGDIFAKITGASLSWTILTYSADWQKNKWVFGDSYCSNYSSARMPYWLQNKGFDNFMLSAFPGAKSADAYTDWKTALNHSTPKYALWLMGVNDPDVDANTANTVWLEYVGKFISDCQEKGITPILSTIPNTPNSAYSNVAKNKWVRLSGHRYIDAAEAVGAVEAGSSWYSGCLGSDNIHPTEKGAVLLAARTLADVPELEEATVRTENFVLKKDEARDIKLLQNADTVLTRDVTRIKNDLEKLETTVGGKASTESVQNLNSSKLSKPTSGIEVGKYFRVASIDELGNPVLEACDLPIASIVKSGMTSNTDPAWTASEQLSARQRMGMDKEWVLKGEIVGDETDRGKIDTGVSVDLSGCTELRIIGTATATGNVSIFTSGSALAYNAFTASRKAVYGVWTSTDIGIDCIVCKYSTSSSARIIADNMSGYCWTNNKKVKDITKILFNTPANITSCDVKIYAR